MISEDATARPLTNARTPVSWGQEIVNYPGEGSLLQVKSCAFGSGEFRHVYGTVK